MREKDLLKLELSKILAKVKEYTSSPATREYIDRLRPHRQELKVREEVEDTRVFLNLLKSGLKLPIGEFEDVRPYLKRAKIEGAWLSAKELHEVLKVVTTLRVVKDYLKRLSKEYPNLRKYEGQIGSFKEIERELRHALDEKGFLKDEANFELASLRKRIRNLERQIVQTLERFIEENAKYVADRIVTLRQGRYVVALKTSYAKRIRGIAHGVSSSGKTTFFEPALVVGLNNRLVELREAEEREVKKVLRFLTSVVGKKADELLRSFEILVHLDWLWAKAKFGNEIGARFPEISPTEVYLKNTKHPLLVLNLGDQNVVAIDLILTRERRGLVITGPNTGGKTVALKTLGLNALMFQLGIPIICEEGSKLRVFDKIFTDIGDEQNIEQNLSTFAGHIKNIADFLYKTDSNTLVLIDELGAGTDPVEGSALGRALLEYFEKVNAYTVVTTHHTPIKLYALESTYYTPASVLFDEESLKPLYKLAYNTIGGSHALDIAQRLGLKRDIVEKARSYLKMEVSAEYEKATQELQKYAREYHEKLKEAEILKKQIEESEREIRKLREELEREKLRRWKGAIKEAEEFLITLKAQALQRIEEAKTKSEVEKLINELSQSVKEKKEKLSRIEEVKEGEKYLYKGSQVKALKVKGDKVLVQSGAFKIWVDKTDLEKPDPLKGTKTIPSERKVEIKVSSSLRKSKGMAEIDLRGKTAEEAKEELLKFLDKAHLSGVSLVRIIHGIGTGVLKRVTEEVLEETPYVAFYREGTPSEGGAGVTVAQLE
ncbi:MAG: endonuclease MutS2 [Gammaproteobacteria bacterium]|nr:MAG: endonuclease MutS2 [Gammaproteobacteria bacterium]